MNEMGISHAERLMYPVPISKPRPSPVCLPIYIRTKRGPESGFFIVVKHLNSCLNLHGEWKS